MGNIALKKIYCFYKNLKLQIDPPHSNCSKKLQHPERKLRLDKVLRKTSCLEKVAVPEVTFTSANVYNCSYIDQ